MPASTFQPGQPRNRTATTTSIVLAFASVYFFWGSTYTAIRIGAAQMPALLLAGTRFLIAGAILLAWCRWRGLRLALAAEDHADAGRDRVAVAGRRQRGPGVCGEERAQRPGLAGSGGYSALCCAD